MDQVQERISTAEDGPTTVNERLSRGGPGPEGQPDTATERLSGSQLDAKPTADELEADDELGTETPVPATRRRATKS